MNEIRALLKIAARRMEMTAFIATLHGAAVVLAALAFVLALADRAPGESFIAWIWVAPALAAACLAAAAVLWSRRRPSELQVALAVDDRLDLREKLSTALHCHRRDDAFAQAAVEDAVNAATDPRTRETVRRRFSVTAPHQWWVSPLIAIAAFGVLMLPQADLFAREDPDEEQRAAARDEADQTIEAVVEIIEEHDLLKSEVADLVEDITASNTASDALDKPEDVKRDALKKVTDLNRKLDDIINGDKGKTSEALKKMFADLEPPESGAAKDMAEALAKGDFSEAKKALEKMLEEAKQGGMDQKQKDELAKQLENMADQLEQLAQQQKQLEKALEQAGLNPQLANNPQALQQAIQQAQNLNQQQKQQLQQMAQAQQQAQQMCKGMGGACKQLAQAMKNGQGMQQAGQQAMGQLNQMEQLQQLLQQAQLAAQQCQGQCKGLGQGINMNQLLQQWKQGGGMGGWGQGAGGKAPIQQTPWKDKMVKADAPIVAGEIIGMTLIDGEPITGESKAELKSVAAKAAKGYDEAQSEDQLPQEYHKALMHYFGELQKQIEATPVETDGDEEEGEAGGDEEGGDEETEEPGSGE